MSKLRAYPPLAPRLVVTGNAMSDAARQLAATSSRARLRWRVARNPYVGRWLWCRPSVDVQHAWQDALRYLEPACRNAVIGVLSESGPQQRLTLVPARGDRVVKVALHESGDAVIERERANLFDLRRTSWRHLGPEVQQDPRTLESLRAVLLTERIPGRHPRWDDREVHAMLVDVLTRTDGGATPMSPTGLAHGDVTPWNVVAAADGSLTLLDWEFTDFATPVHPVCSLLDFVLRGAVVARARLARVRPVVLRVLDDVRVSDVAAVGLYGSYRDRVASVAAGRSDALARRADRLLRASLHTAPQG